jgi:hypothetical protein
MFSSFFRRSQQNFNKILTTSYKDKLQPKHVDKSFYNLKNISYKDKVFFTYIPIQKRILTTSYKDKLEKT